MDSLVSIFPNIWGNSLVIGKIVIPLGVSFYTFKNISVIVDLYKSKISNISFINYSLFVTFFPQILSGPISRIETFLSDLKICEIKFFHNDFRFRESLPYLIFGLLKKFVFASLIFPLYYEVFQNSSKFSSFDVIIGILSFSFYIYLDFSGYSDISNSISNLLGFSMIKNFDEPYKSSSLVVFWKRWHISFSSWLKDYIYIPLGGNRNGIFRKYLNIFITFLIGGIWHGANITFIVWGLLNGIGVVFSHLINDIKKKFNIIIKNKFITFFSVLITFIYINICWLFFNSSNIDQSFEIINKIKSLDFGFNSYLSIKIILVLFFIFVFILFEKRLINFVLEKFKIIRYRYLFPLLIIIFYIIIKMGPELVAPFIYFNF